MRFVVLNDKFLTVSIVHFKGTRKHYLLSVAILQHTTSKNVDIIFVINCEKQWKFQNKIIRSTIDVIRYNIDHSKTLNSIFVLRHWPFFFFSAYPDTAAASTTYFLATGDRRSRLPAVPVKNTPTKFRDWRVGKDGSQPEELGKMGQSPTSWERWVRG